MKIFTIAFTQRGIKLQSKIKEILSNKNNKIVESLGEQVLVENFTTENISLKEFTKVAFEQAQQIIFVGAAGIAVRAISPYVKSKVCDPGVIVIDELGKYVIPVLSGHIGGSNQVSELIAAELNSTTGAIPVITTATDINNVFAVDTWAVKNGLKIKNADCIKHISSAVLKGEKIGILISKFCKNSKNIEKELMKSYSGFVKGTDNVNKIIEISPFRTSQLENKENTKESNKVFCLKLVPNNIFVGVGCRKEKEKEALAKLYSKTLEELDLEDLSINSVCTIDIKKNEKAILELCSFHNIALNTFSAEILNQANQFTDYIFSESELVKRTTGTGNVCERAAFTGAHNFKKNTSDFAVAVLKDKYKIDGMTIAIVALL